MTFVSRLIDRSCLAIYLRGWRAHAEQARGAAARKEAAENEIFAPFIKVWPFSEIEFPGLARRRFVDLSEADRARAVRWAPVYIVHPRQYRPMSAEQWLRRKGWEWFSGDLDDDAAAEARLREYSERRQSSR